jgi:hypothetical protein
MATIRRVGFGAYLLVLRHWVARLSDLAMHDRFEQLNVESFQYSFVDLELCAVTELSTIRDFTIWYIASVTLCLSISNSA